MIKKWLLLLLLLLFAVALGAQERRGAPENEQRNFSMEQEIVPIRVPAILPEGALLALASDRSVSSCLHKQNSSPTHPPATWFVASEIHLYAPDEIDLIVLPAILKAQRSMSPAPNACFIGPYTSRFWVLRETAKGYDLVLAVDAHDLSVLRSKWKGHYEIETSVSTLHGTKPMVFRFDGRLYRQYEK